MIIEITNNETLKWSYSYHLNAIPMANVAWRIIVNVMVATKCQCVSKFRWNLAFPFPIDNPHPTF
jgi:hypothetical protein